MLGEGEDVLQGGDRKRRGATGGLTSQGIRGTRTMMGGLAACCETGKVRWVGPAAGKAGHSTINRAPQRLQVKKMQASSC